MTDTATRIIDTTARSQGIGHASGTAPAVSAPASAEITTPHDTGAHATGHDTTDRLSLSVAHHPWVLIRSNQVDATNTPDRTDQVAAALTVDVAQADLEAAVDAFVAATMPFGRAEQPAPVRQAARKLARLARRSVRRPLTTGDASAATDIRDLPSVDSSVDPTEWLAAADAHDRASRALDAIVDAQLAADRSRLRDVLAHPSLRLAAPLSSPTLAAAAARYAAGSVSSSLRKSEPHLQRLASRALDRVSPFSHYTAVGLGWTAEPVPGTQSGARPATAATKLKPELERHVSVDLASFTRLVRARLDALGPATPLVAARSTIGMDGRRRVRVDVDDPSCRSRTIDGSMRTVTVRDTPAVGALLAAARTPADAATLAQRFVGNSGGQGLADPRITAAISALVTVGALRTWNPVPVRTDDTARATATALRGYADTISASPDAAAATIAALLALADDLDAIAAAVDRVAATGPDERRASVIAVERAWAAVGGSTARPVYEDVTMPEVAAIDPSVLAPVRDDLGRLAAVCDLFDSTHIGHALLHRGLVARRGGRTTLPFDEFVELVPQILRQASTDREGMLAEVCAHDPAVARLVSLREDAAESLRRAGLRGDNEVRWTEAQLDRWSREIPARLRRPRSSLAWFVQTVSVAADVPAGLTPVVRTEAPAPLNRVVLNAVHDGDAQMFSRFLGSFGGAALAAVRDRLADELGPDEIEVAPVHGFNANVHPWLLASAFDTDGLAADQTRVDPSALTVHIGEHAVWADLAGRRIHPHYFGFLVPFLLPATEAALYMLGRGPLVRMDLGTDIERGVGRDDIVSHPRVVAGSIVVTRRAWSLPVAAFPVPRPGESLAETLRRMSEFRARHGIDERVFIRPEPATDALWQQFVAMRSKPLAVDLTSPLDLRCLPAWLADAVRVRVTEALPDTAARPSDPFGFGSCTEYVLETVTTATRQATGQAIGEAGVAEGATHTAGAER